MMAIFRELSNKPFMHGIKMAFYNPHLIVPFIRRRLFGQILPPNNLSIRVNEMCNARCKMCNLPIYRTPPEFDIKLFKKLISEVKSFKPVISLKMTEPTLKKDLCEFVKICSQNGLESVVTTNGFLLPKLAEDLVKAGLTKIQISVDEIGNKHDEIRRLKGCFKNAVRGIKKLVYYKEKYNSKLKIFVNFTIFDENYMSMMKFLKYFEKFPLEFLKFSHVNFPISEIPRKIDTKKLYRLIKQIKGRKNKVRVKFLPDLNEKELYEYYHEKKFLKGYSKCYIPYTHCIIDYNGDVKPDARCTEEILGNIKKQKFLDIWYGEKYRKFRERLKKEPFKICIRCCGVMTAPRHFGWLQQGIEED